MDKFAPIGTFDSGFGGLTVLRSIKALLPSEPVIYFGDTARLPYGTKSGETVLRYSLENADLLLSMGVKVLVVACHTACSFALKELERTLPVPVVGVISPSIEKIRSISPEEKVGIIATRATIRSGVYQAHFKNPLTIACPLFVPLVEEGLIDHPITTMAIQEYLEPIKGTDIDTLLLGCTHYPLLAQQIKKFLGPQISLVDPGEACAHSLKRLLSEKDLVRPAGSDAADRFLVSDAPEQFRLLGPVFLGQEIGEVITTGTILELCKDRILR